MFTDPVDRQVPNVRPEAGTGLDLGRQLLDGIEVQLDHLGASPADQMMMRRSLRRPLIARLAVPRTQR